MSIEWEAGASLFPPVLWVDAIKRGVAIDLIFGTRIEGQGVNLRIRIGREQWENLKYLVDGPPETPQ
jgi:hypothetical protein